MVKLLYKLSEKAPSPRGRHVVMSKWLLAVMVASVTLAHAVAGTTAPGQASRRERPVASVAASSPAQGTDELADEINRSIVAGIRRKYGHRPCALEWLGLIERGSEDGFLIAQVIAEDDCKNLFPAVVHALMSANENVRTDAAWLLGRLGEESSAEALIPLTRDPNGTVATQALESICILSSSRCTALLRTLAEKGRTWQVRHTALQVMRKQHQQLDSPLVASLLHDDRPEVVIEAMKLLDCDALTRDGEMIQRLTDLLRTQDRWEAATATLGRCRIRSAGPALKNLLQQTLSDGYAIPATLVDAVTVCAGEDARAVLEQYVLQSSSTVGFGRIGAANVTSGLEHAVRGLAEVGGRSSLGAIRHALADPYYRVRRAALSTAEVLGIACELEDEVRTLSDDISPEVRKQVIEMLERCAAIRAR